MGQGMRLASINFMTRHITSKFFLILFFIYFLCIHSIVHAQQNAVPPIPAVYHFSSDPAGITCVLEAARYYDIPSNALLAIISTERGKNGHKMLNTNGTYDLGHMQINTSTFAREIAPMGFSVEDAQWRGCLNIYMGAYLIKKHLVRTPNADFWDNLANYHSKTPTHHARYKSNLLLYAKRWEEWLNQHYATQYVGR